MKKMNTGRKRSSAIKFGQLALVVLGPWFSLISWGCADGNPCDADNMVRDRNFCVCAEGYSLVGRECVLTPEVPNGEGGAGGDSGTGGSGSPAEPVAPDEFFGEACTVGDDAADCGGAAPTCAAAPGKTEGTCSVLGCSSEPDAIACPIGWSCFELGDVCLQD